MNDINFDAKYILQEFRELQKDYFDEDGGAYKNSMSTDFCELMLTLINTLELQVKHNNIRGKVIKILKETIQDGVEDSEKILLLSLINEVGEL